MDMELTGPETISEGRYPTFMIVDDAAPVRTILQRHLENLGIEKSRVLVAEDGEKALELFKEHRPSVVLLDLLLPGIDGEEVARAIFEEDPEAKVVVVTGRQREDEQSSRLMAMGAFDFVTKPVRRDEVKRVLWELAAEEGRVGRIA